MPWLSLSTRYHVVRGPAVICFGLVPQVPKISRDLTSTFTFTSSYSNYHQARSEPRSVHHHGLTRWSKNECSSEMKRMALPMYALAVPDSAMESACRKTCSHDTDAGGRISSICRPLLVNNESG